MSAKHPRKPAKHPARPIRTKRDLEGAAAAAKHLSAQAEFDAAAEARLQSLLHELDKFEASDDEPDDDGADGYDGPGSGRRWSDERTDDD